MVGDRLNTDIEFGKNGGLSTLLVMTGAFSVTGLAVKKKQGVLLTIHHTLCHQVSQKNRRSLAPTPRRLFQTM
jgi:ribonucleotide monophosphatase NagD (HAD superfamily)